MCCGAVRPAQAVSRPTTSRSRSWTHTWLSPWSAAIPPRAPADRKRCCHGRIPGSTMHCTSRYGGLTVHIPKDLVAASATPLVLGILAGGESYGYAIIKHVGEVSGGQLEWTDGLLYPLLHRL